MTTFIYDVLGDLHNKGYDLSKLTFVLPSKRAGVFLKNQLPHFSNKPIFAPEIISIEEFVEDLSMLQKVDNVELLFQFYESYKQNTTSKDSESFDSFCKWAQILLQDFNEIDRYLIPQERIFNYISAIKDIENKHWSLEENQTEFTKKYLAFWNKLPIYYNAFTNRLLKNKQGYQGLLYRIASENIQTYIQSKPDMHYVFLGFNALNTAEETIIQNLLKHQLADIYWDVDASFINDPIHDAGLFTREHKKNWGYYGKHPFNWITEHYSKSKNISIIGIPKNVGQAKYVGQILKELSTSHTKLENTAVILGDENLLTPLLNSFPPEISALNITMGMPLKNIPLASLFEHLFELHKNSSALLYYKDVVKIISHAFIRPLFQNNHKDDVSEIINIININNLAFLNVDKLNAITNNQYEKLLGLLFNKWETSISKSIENCQNLILILKNYFDNNKKANLLSLEYLYRFHELFNVISRYNAKYHHIKDIATLHTIFKELLSSETLDFKGEPLQGLQIMGMLESRVLDFETVIITSVNEGILPAGKTNNSFIPYDVKLQNKLPTYKEKDAVYTYHFYRLLQRAKNIFLLYNTEADILNGGEKSRFIKQLEFDKNLHHIQHQIISPKIPVIENQLKIIEKTVAVLDRLKEIASKGFSPSALTNYIRNPIDFYYDKILRLKDLEDVEETIEANTLGSVVHNTLEDFYKPLEGKILTIEIINQLKKNINNTVRQHFKEIYKEGDITKGKNLIIFEIAKRYILNFLNLELSTIKEGNVIKIISIESDKQVPIEIPELDFSINLTGKVDRVDEYNGVMRIIDYKTGKVEPNQVQVVNWEDITTDYNKFSKSFQILTYAYMLQKSTNLRFPFEAGIISFKNLGSGLMKFGKKEKSGSRDKNNLIDNETMEAFENELKKLIIEICDPKINFIEKEV